MKIKSAKNRCLIVAEISANHRQDFKTAVRLVKEAGLCGAGAVKFQAYTPDTLTINADNKYFKVKHPKWKGRTLYRLYEKAYTPWSWFKDLKKVADDLGLIFFATAFDKRSVDFLEGLRVPIHKVASFELIDLPFIEYIAKTRKPLILSTGMATLGEIRQAVNTAKKAGAKDIILLKCVSGYPAKEDQMNLKTIPHMRKLFKCPIGLSDHTLGTAVPVAAVSLGAEVIEKHFTLSRKLKTADNFFSLEPKEFRELVKDVRIAESALGNVTYGPTEGERESIIFRRSLFAISDIHKGDVIAEENVRSIRPGCGLKPKYLKRIIGARARCDIKRGTPIRWGLVSR